MKIEYLRISLLLVGIGLELLLFYLMSYGFINDTIFGITSLVVLFIALLAAFRIEQMQKKRKKI